MAIRLKTRVFQQQELTLAEARRRRRMRSQREQFRALVDSLPVMSNSAESIHEDRDRGHRSDVLSR
ncbi:MAG: hypothetical protein ABSG26_00440 [Bryobacteraceae bacterium]|jgi:hypothetical protein